MLGQPVSHSLSPALHQAAYRALGLDGWTYEAIEVGVGGLPALLGGLDRTWAGLSVTMPLKHAVLELAAEIRPLARAVGSANTLVPGAGGWVADNTDVAGIVAALAEYAVAPRTVTVLGAGGTSLGAVATANYNATWGMLGLLLSAWAWIGAAGGRTPRTVAVSGTTQDKGNARDA